jgi:hypothetical protein
MEKSANILERFWRVKHRWYLPPDILIVHEQRQRPLEVILDKLSRASDEGAFRMNGTGKLGEVH